MHGTLKSLKSQLLGVLYTFGGAFFPVQAAQYAPDSFNL